jgi:hypothetical protein
METLFPDRDELRSSADCLGQIVAQQTSDEPEVIAAVRAVLALTSKYHPVRHAVYCAYLTLQPYGRVTVCDTLLPVIELSRATFT